MKKFAPVLVTIALTLSSSCSLIKNLDEMHNGMQVMATQMPPTTQEVRDISDDMYIDLRQGNSLTIRSECIERMEATPRIKTKIAEAAAYVMSFEFQLVKTIKADTEQKRNDLVVDAILEFDRQLDRYIRPGDTEDPTATDDRLRNLYALSAVLHQINSNTARLAAQEKRKPVSLLSVIEDTLALEVKASRDPDLESSLNEGQRVILQHKAQFVLLLKVRANFLAAAALAEISALNDIDQDSGTFTKLSMYLKSWEPRFTEMNLQEVRDAAKLLKEANREIVFLKSIGVDTKIFGRLHSVYENMNVPAIKAEALKLSALQSLNSQIAVLLTH